MSERSKPTKSWQEEKNNDSNVLICSGVFFLLDFFSFLIWSAKRRQWDKRRKTRVLMSSLWSNLSSRVTHSFHSLLEVLKHRENGSNNDFREKAICELLGNHTLGDWWKLLVSNYWHVLGFILFFYLSDWCRSSTRTSPVSGLFTIAQNVIENLREKIQKRVWYNIYKTAQNTRHLGYPKAATIVEGPFLIPTL